MIYPIFIEKTNRNGASVRLPEKLFDRKLQIKTVGLREWSKEAHRYNRYEATPYSALEQLFEVYSFQEGDQLIDFGCGRGRVVFYIHSRFDIPVTGIEANDKTFEEALINKEMYFKKRRHLKSPIHFEYALAEQYEIAEEYNKFYFFNPFSIHIFKRVMTNILHSFKRKPRTMELILYYPLPDFTYYLQNHTPFKMINRIKVIGDHGKYGKFEIYRLINKE